MIPIFLFVFLFVLGLASLIVWYAIASGLWLWFLIAFVVYVVWRTRHAWSSYNEG